ncbi:MAG: D-alanyl-D-alanine carboxypeptidase [Rhodobacteraceae bacterium]|nr:D-alanyl-D-alanine carboxypeptidase [Paracoccaceae bacterium]
MKLVGMLLLRVVFSVGTLIFLMLGALLLANSADASKYASMVMDARNGKILYSSNATTRLHPASLTKMMTVYVAIHAVENGEIDLDTRVRISKFAASEPPSKMYFKPGSRVKLRHLIRAAAVRSANDAATAIAEAVSGSESAFAARMNRTALAMGMTQTTFRNAHGLTQKGHLSTARDMTILGRHLIYDYEEYFHLFSKRTADVGGTTVRNTNRRFLASYAGADGIKTGFTNGAGFNLTATAMRGKERIIVTVFGGRSRASRDKHVAELMDKGFKLARSGVALRPPARPDIPFSVVNRVDTTVDSAGRRLRRPASAVAVAMDVGDATVPSAETPVTVVAELQLLPESQIPLPYAKPHRRPLAAAVAGNELSGVYGIALGRFPTPLSADRRLAKSILIDADTLAWAEKKITRSGGMYSAEFVGLSGESADRACKMLVNHGVECSLLQVEYGDSQFADE